ncbi:cell division protein SepF [Rarobacter incanus]
MLYLGFGDNRDEQGDLDYDGGDQYYDDPDQGQQDVAQYEAPVTHLRPAVQETNSGAGELKRITTIHPRSYNDARLIGEAFREGTPVIINLSDMTDADAKRLVDFSAGLIFGLHGHIERVTAKVFLLSPETVEIDSEGGASEGTRAGFYNQS